MEGGKKEEMLLQLQQLRFKASELLLREEWHSCIDACSHFISLCQQSLSAGQPQPYHDEQQQDKLKKWLCLALSNRAEARRRLRHLPAALLDCNHAIQIDAAHYKSLLCKGTILLDLDRYSAASDCFKRALQLQSSDGLQSLLDRCRKLDSQSRTGAVDLSDWVLSGFHAKAPELAEFVGPVEIKQSEESSSARRGLFATKDLEAGALLVVTKPVAIGRAILPDSGDDCRKSARIVMWKDFVGKVLEAARRSRKTLQLIYALSTGEDEQGLRVPDLNLFRPETEESCFGEEEEGKEEIPDMGRILKILDVNSMTEDGISATALGKKDNVCFFGVGLWVLPAFINHSCNPNARRLHIGDHMAVHTSRDVKAGEEITFAYFDVLLPLRKRRELSRAWEFCCSCKRCRFEEEFHHGEELNVIEMRLENELGDGGETVVELEQSMKRWMVKGKERGFLRASFWPAFSATFKCQRQMRRWGRRIPPPAIAAESIVEAVGGDERVVSLVVDAWKKAGVSMDMEDLVMKLGKGIYGKVMRKKAMRALLEQALLQQ